MPDNDQSRLPWERIKALFNAAMELPPEQRGAYLDRECAEPDGPMLRREVESLLLARTHGAVKTGLAPRVVAAEATTHFIPITEKPGEVIGPYKLLQVIGEGGFGTVFMAEQQKPVVRKVALKIIKLGMDTRQVVARFEQERQALALMDHPNIAKVFDGGATDSGRPFFVMEYIRGVPITEYADANNLSPSERLELFISVCRAVQHAHHKGVIHRDLKPSNILITLHDGKPVPKVIDFGIAKATQARLTEKTLFTEHKQFIGTPAYMAPEQAELSGLDIDTRADVYALGVLLYELLTGSTPFDTKRLLEAGYAEMQRIIREVEPPKPSTRVATLAGEIASATAARRRIEPSKFTLTLRGDLDWMVMKALEKDRARRYDTPVDFLQDVERHLSGEPVVAAPPSTAYRVRKFVRRNKARVIAAGAVFATLVLGIIGTSAGLAVAARRAEGERLANAEAQRQRAIAEEQRIAAESLTLQETAARQAAELATYRSNIAAAKIAIDDQAGEVARDRLDACPSHLTGWEWGYLDTRLDDALFEIKHPETASWLSYDISPDGRRLLTSGWGTKVACLWDGVNGRSVGTIEPEQGEKFRWVQFSPDGREIEALTMRVVSRGPRSEAWRNGVELLSSVLQSWDSTTLKVIRRVELPGSRATEVILSPDRTKILCINDSYNTDPAYDYPILIDSADPTRRVTLDAGATGRDAGGFSPDSSLVWTGEAREQCLHSIWSADDGRFLTRVSINDRCDRPVFSNDGSTMALVGTNTGRVYVTDPRTGEVGRILEPPGGVDLFGGWGGPRARFSPDGSKLITQLQSQLTAVVWNTSTWQEITRINSRQQMFGDMWFSPDGACALIGTQFGIEVWESQTGKRLTALPGALMNRQAFSSESTSPFDPTTCNLVVSAFGGRLLVMGPGADPGRTWLAKYEHVRAIWTDPATHAHMALLSVQHPSDDGKPRGWKQSCEIVNLDSGERRAIELPTDSWGLHFDPLAGVIVCTYPTGFIILDIESGEVIAKRDFSKVGYFAVSVGSTHRLLLTQPTTAVADLPKPAELLVWDYLRDEIVWTTLIEGGLFADYEASPRGDRIVVGSRSGGSSLIDAATGDVLAAVDSGWEFGLDAPAVFSPEGERFAHVVRDRSASPERFTRQSVLLRASSDASPLFETALPAQCGQVAALRWSWDASRLAVATWGGDDDAGCLFLINPETGGLLWQAKAPGVSIENIEFTPDGSRVVTSDSDSGPGLIVWDATDGTALMTLTEDTFAINPSQYPHQRSFTADGEALLVRHLDGRYALIHSLRRRSSSP